MSADRCPTCDREACPNFPPLTHEAMDDGVGEPCRVCLVSRECERHAVDWRAETLTLRTRCLAAEAARDEATRRLAALEASDATEADALRVAVEDHLPVYALSEDDDDTANHAERIEYAGDEIKSLTRRLAVVEEAVRVALAKADRLVTCLRDVTDIENLNRAGNICRDLRAALEKQP